jgi:hypothetical protein
MPEVAVIGDSSPSFVARARRTMLLCLVKGFGRHFGGLVFWSLEGLFLPGCWVADKTGMGRSVVEGKLL